MKYNEKVERFAPKLGRKNLVNGLSCPPFVYMEDSEDGMWVHYVKYCEAIAKLKGEIESLENLAKSSSRDFASEYNELKIEIFKLQGRVKELEAERDAFEKSFNEMTEAFMQSQRALWLARANSARNKVRFFGWAFDCYDIDTLINIDGHKYKMPRQNRLLACHHWIEIFENVEQLCKQKAKEYK